jgi:hypothetical protein
MFAPLIKFDGLEKPRGNTGPGGRSAIERHFPRVADELVAKWRTGDVDPYLMSLLIDDRGDRLGFPSEVLDELVMLSGMRWHLGHGTSIPIEETRMEEFHFGVTDWDPAQIHTLKGAWVLV